MTSLTVYGNVADGGGGGMAVTAGAISVDNSIFDENSVKIPWFAGPFDVALAAGVTLSDLGYNLVGASDTMFTNTTDVIDIGGNAGLSNTLTLNGAPAGFPPTLALDATSPGYEKGDPTLLGSTDERGFIRGDNTSIGAEDPDAAPPS